MKVVIGILMVILIALVGVAVYQDSIIAKQDNKLIELSNRIGLLTNSYEDEIKSLNSDIKVLTELVVITDTKRSELKVQNAQLLKDNYKLENTIDELLSELKEINTINNTNFSYNYKYHYDTLLIR